MNNGDTLPKVNIFTQGNNLDTFWNYTESLFVLGMPVVLIVVALLVLEPLFEIIVRLFRRAFEKEDEEETEDF